MTERHADTLELRQRILAAAGASVVSALVVNPLDVVKTRLQVQAAADSKRLQLHPWKFSLEAELVGCSESCRIPNGSHAADCNGYSSTFDSMRKIVRREGARALWRGTDAALLMAIPTVGIYMPLYDNLLPRFSAYGYAAPLLAGSLARTVAVLCTSPLELIRTRMQALLHPSQGSGKSRASATMWAHMPVLEGSTLGRVRTLWRGVGATLARDVPFSAIYWASLEPIRRSLRPRDQPASKGQILAANLAAGSLGGALAAAITTPLDVVKTRTQLADDGRPRRILPTLREVARDEGLRGLFAGGVPRAIRAAPSCAIVLASYELIKAAFVPEAAEQLQCKQ